MSSSTFNSSAPRARANRRTFQQYTRAYACVSLMAIPLLLLNLVFLWRTSELIDVREIAARQHRDGGLYGSAIGDRDVYPYKLALLTDAKPKIVALGSSRTLQIRQQFFKAPFVTLGGGIHSLAHVRQALRDLIRIHPPEVVLLAVDFWWLNAATNLEDTMAAGIDAVAPTMQRAVDPRLPRTDLIPPFIFLPTRWLLEGKVSVKEYLAALSGKMSNPFPTYGAAAMFGKRGYARDGSRYDFNVSPSACGPGPYEFPSIQRLAGRGRPIYKGGRFDPTTWQIFQEILAEAKEARIAVISYLPPVAGPVFKEMKSLEHRYAYVDLRHLDTMIQEHRGQTMLPFDSKAV